jgi:hypothetical protein
VDENFERNGKEDGKLADICLCRKAKRTKAIEEERV